MAEELFKKLQNAANSRSLLAKHLTPDIFYELQNKKTKFGGTLAQCIRSGCENPDSAVGVYASDPDAYDVFAPVMDNVIKDYHKISAVYHPKPFLGDLDNLAFGDLDPAGEMILSTRIRVSRNCANFGFHPLLTKDDRANIERMTRSALNRLGGELEGKYYSLAEMTPETEKELRGQNFLFSATNKCLMDAGCYKDWPAGRGIYLNEDRTFLVWINEEDHLIVISMQRGGDLAAVYTRLVLAIRKLEEMLIFATMPQRGYLTFSPTNLGTALRAGIHIRIPKIAASPEFKKICDDFQLLARRVCGENAENVDGVYEISNERRMAITEIGVVQDMRRGVEEMIAMEKSLQIP